MKSTDTPSLIETVIASKAPSNYVRTIPKTQTKSGSGEMSLALGWPPECATPIAAGGKYPQMADANGVLKLLSAAVQQLQARFMGPYNAAFAQAIGGYPLNAIVSDTQAGLFWVSTAEDNTTVPGDDGASWQSLFAGYATNDALNNEKEARIAGDTDMQSQINDRVLKSGDTMTGQLFNSSWISGGFGGGWNGPRSKAGDIAWTNGIEVGNPYGTGGYRASLKVTDAFLDGGSNQAGINFTGYDAAANVHQWYFAWNGNIQTPKGLVAFESDISNKYIGTNHPNARFYCWNVQAKSGDRINFPVPFTDVESIVLNLTAQDTGRGSWLTYSNITTTSFQLYGRFMRHGHLDQMPTTQVSCMAYGW